MDDRSDLQRTWLSNRSFLGDPIYAADLCHEPRNRDASWKVIFVLFRSKRRLSVNLRNAPTCVPSGPYQPGTPSPTGILQSSTCSVKFSLYTQWRIPLYSWPSEASSCYVDCQAIFREAPFSLLLIPGAVRGSGVAGLLPGREWAFGWLVGAREANLRCVTI